MNDPIAIVGHITGHQNTHCKALEEGLRVLGIPSKRYHSSLNLNVPLVACWNWRTGSRLRDTGAEVLVMERGYIGDRFSWTSMGWNGLNGYATFPPAPEDGGERFQKHHGHLMRPWKQGSGKYVLLIGQVPGDASLKGRDLKPWYATTAMRAASEYRLPVLFRPHPLAHRRGGVYVVPGTKMQYGPLADALEDAAVVVSFNSNTTVESVLAGVPTVAMDRGSMAYSMCSHDIGQPLVTPDRLRWAAELAWRQFSLEEIRSGAALRVYFPDRKSVAA